MKVYTHLFQIQRETGIMPSKRMQIAAQQIPPKDNALMSPQDVDLVQEQCIVHHQTYVRKHWKLIERGDRLVQRRKQNMQEQEKLTDSLRCRCNNTIKQQKEQQDNEK